MTKRSNGKGQTRRSSRADGVTVREVGRRSYVVDFTIDTADGLYRFRRKSPFQTIGESREWGKQHREACLKRGRAEKQPARVDPASPRDFAYWCERFIEEAENPVRAGGANRPATIVSKTVIATKHLIPFFGRRRVDEVAKAFDEYLRAKAREGLALSTIRLHAAHLRGVLALAKTQGNPREKAIDVPKIKIPRSEKVPTTLSERQTDQLFDEFADAPAWQLAVLTLLFRCGLRAGEALGLRWPDVDFERGTIRIQRSAGQHGVGPTKGGRARPVSLHWQVVDALSKLGRGDAWVFPSRSRTTPRCYTSVRDQLVSRWDACGFIDDDGNPIRWRTHIGRHSLGRHWAERGWPLKGLQEMLGHRDITTTMIYAHWSQASTAPLLDQLGRRPLRLVKAR